MDAIIQLAPENSAVCGNDIQIKLQSSISMGNDFIYSILHFFSLGTYQQRTYQRPFVGNVFILEYYTGSYYTGKERTRRKLENKKSFFPCFINLGSRPVVSDRWFFA